MGKLKHLYDFRELALTEKLFELPLSRQEVNDALADVRVRFLTIVETEGPVETGDIVVIDLPAADDEEAKTVQINVGKRFYDDSFEDHLVGLERGAAVTMPSRDKRRAGVLIQIKRRAFPPLTDELIGRMGIKDVTTVEAYRGLVEDRLIARAKKKKQDPLVMVVMRDTAGKSEFDGIAEDAERVYLERLADLRNLAEIHHVEFEELLASSVPAQYTSAAERESYLREQAELTAKEQLIGRYFMERDGKTISEENWRKMKQDYIAQGADPAQVEQMLTYDCYVSQAALDSFRQRILSYYDDRFKVVEI